MLSDENGACVGGDNAAAPLARERTCHQVMSDYRKYRYEKFKGKYEHNDGQKKDQ